MQQGLRFAIGSLLGLLASTGCALTPSSTSPSLAERSNVRRVGFEEETPPSTVPEQVNQTFRQLTGTGRNPEVAKTLFAEAEAEYLQAAALRKQNKPGEAKARFNKAASRYASAAARWPGSGLQQDALFMVGECNFFADRYPAANEAYEKLLKEYPNSRHLDLAEARRFSIAQYWMQASRDQPYSWYWVNTTDGTRPYRDSFGNAIRVFDRIRLDDPTGKLADDATLAAGAAFFTNNKFLRADEFLTDLRVAYPSSDHQFRAHLLGIEAKLKSYQGPDYSGDALIEAEKLIKKVRRTFPTEAQQEDAYLRRAYAEVRQRMGEREFLRGKYYDWRSEFGAARHHYQNVIDDFGDTPYAQQARRRLADIQGRPSVPSQKLPWLANWFPEEDEQAPLIANGSQNPQR